MLIIRTAGRLGKSFLRLTSRVSLIAPSAYSGNFIDHSLAIPMSMFKKAVLSVLRPASQGDADGDANESLRQVRRKREKGVIVK